MVTMKEAKTAQEMIDSWQELLPGGTMRISSNSS